MSNLLLELSNQISDLAQGVSQRVVAVQARRGYASSGVYWRQNLILSAAHTIRREQDIVVTLPDGRASKVELAGAEPGSDIAVLRLTDQNHGLPELPALSARKDLRVGQLAFVVGRSPDSGPNLSAGVIGAFSGPWRTWGGGRLDNYIRIDAHFYPMSSGGAVVDAKGEIVGVATSALSRIAGLAVPVASLESTVKRVLEKGHLGVGYLGIGLQPVSIPESLRTRAAATNQVGIVVLSVEPGGPAEQGGLLIGDIILSLDDAVIEDVSDIQAALTPEKIGKPVRVRIIRGGNAVDVQIIIGERAAGRRA
jgi:S1-C subfamily serine protease